MKEKYPIWKYMDELEESFLLWDEEELARFVLAVVNSWGIKGGIGMKNKGLCAKCIHDKDCDYPRKFPVHACDDFTPSKNDSYEEIQKWSSKE